MRSSSFTGPYIYTAPSLTCGERGGRRPAVLSLCLDVCLDRRPRLHWTAASSSSRRLAGRPAAAVWGLAAAVGRAAGGIGLIRPSRGRSVCWRRTGRFPAASLAAAAARSPQRHPAGRARERPLWLRLRLSSPSLLPVSSSLLLSPPRLPSRPGGNDPQASVRPLPDPAHCFKKAFR